MGKTAIFAKFSNIFEFSQNKSKDAIFAILKYLNVRAKNHKMQFLPFISIFEIFEFLRQKLETEFTNFSINFQIFVFRAKSQQL